MKAPRAGALGPSQASAALTGVRERMKLEGTNELANDKEHKRKRGTRCNQPLGRHCQLRKSKENKQIGSCSARQPHYSAVACSPHHVTMQQKEAYRNEQDDHKEVECFSPEDFPVGVAVSRAEY
jgi:hypothetical protein